MSRINASTLRVQIEAALANRIPAALSPAARTIHPVASTGISAVDELLHGGLPLGAITEISGPECSGRTSLALSFIAGMIAKSKACAWIDVSNSFHPESAAAAGIDLHWLLWVRCGATKSSYVKSPQANTSAMPDKSSTSKDAFAMFHSGGCGGHPRGEVKGLSEAVSVFLRPQHATPCSGEPQPRLPLQRKHIDRVGTQASVQPKESPKRDLRDRFSNKPWSRIEQALRVADLLLQAGGFGALVLDMAGLAPEYATRIPLATWFRYRGAAERTQTACLLLTQHSCARSSVELLLRMQPGDVPEDKTTVFSGHKHRITVSRQRFQPQSDDFTSRKIVSIRKPVQSIRETTWQSIPSWSGIR